LLATFVREVRYYQKTVGLLFPRRSFALLVKQIADEFSNTGLRWRASALYALQYAAEDALTMQMSML